MAQVSVTIDGKIYRMAAGQIEPIHGQRVATPGRIGDHAHPQPRAAEVGMVCHEG